MIDRFTYAYFMSYSFVTDIGEIGFGNITYTFGEPIKSLDEIKRVEARISKDKGHPGVVILFYQLLDSHID